MTEAAASRTLRTGAASFIIFSLRMRGMTQAFWTNVVTLDDTRAPWFL